MTNNRPLLYALLVVLLAGLIVAVGWAGYNLLSLAFESTPTPTAAPTVVTVVVVATPTATASPATTTTPSPAETSLPSTTTPTLLQLTYRRVRNDVTYTVETSPTLIGGTWTSVGVTQGTPAPDGTTTASIAITPGSGFLRLSVTR